MTLGERIEKLNPETLIALKNKYGTFWLGKAKYVFSAVTPKAWGATDIEVVIL